MLATLLGAPDPARAQTVREDVFITNGTVNAQAVVGGTLYLGGSFTHVGPVTGAAVPLDPGSGAALPGFPKVSGRVHAICPDGVGGWFIGGAFASVGGLPRANLARIRPDLSVADWDPGTNGIVRAIAVQGSTVYVGGDFTSSGGQARNRIAAIDTTSALATSWNPDASNSVYALAVQGGVLYAGGQFTTIGGQARNRIAGLDVGTGLATSWNPNSNSLVSALAVDGSTVYAAGSFTAMGVAPRNRLAALDAGTGVATAWNPNANDQVLALAVTPGTVYAGGVFTVVGGQSRGRIAAIDANSGVVTPWNPGAGAPVLALAVAAGNVYAGGDFLTIGGQSRSRLAALDAGTGAATAWDPTASGSVSAITATGSVVYAGGDFTGMGGVERSNLAAFDLASGAPTSWDPSADDEVTALLAHEGVIYAGGRFGLIGGHARANLAVLDSSGNAFPAWNPGTNGPVTALAAMDSVVYAGGLFTAVGGAPRQNLAAVGAATGLVQAWNPGASDQVLALAVHEGAVYAGGQFTTLGGQPRNRIGAVDAGTGAARPWNPNANGTVRALDAGCGTIYAGGFFSTIGGQVRSGVAALSATSGSATAWNPTANGPLFAVAVRGPVVYVGGIFSTVGAQPRLRIAALSVSTGMATPWNPGSDGVIRSLAVDDSSVYAAGTFSMVGSTSQSNIAVISADASITCPPIALLPATLEEGRSGTPYTQLLSAGGGAAPYCFAVTAGGLPPGLSLDPASGAIDGLPATEGTFTFTATATDVAGCQGARAYSILIRPACPAIAILPDTLPAGRALEPYAQSLVAPDATPPLTWSVTAGALPDGLTLTAGTGDLSGTPTSAGSFAFTIDVLDSNLCTASRAYDLTIREVCPALAIAPAVIPDGTVGAVYQRTLSAPLAAPPITWSLASGSLPDGITLDAGAGTLSGTPTATGSFSFEVRATDANLCTASRGYTVTMFDSLPASSVAAGTAGLAISPVNPCVTVPVLLTRGESAPLRALSVTVQLDTALFALCTPAAPGSSIRPGPWLDDFVTAFQVTDNGGGSYTVDQAILGLPCGQTDGGELFTLDLAAIGGAGLGTVAIDAVHARDCDNQPVAVGSGPDALLAVCDAPIAVSPAALPDGSVGTPYDQTLSAGSGAAPFTWSLISGTLPDGLTLGAGTGVLSGTPAAAGSFTFEVRTIDADLCTGSRGYTVTMFDSLPASSVAAATAGLSISTANPCATVPVVLTRGESAPLRAISVTIQLDTLRLALCTPEAPDSSIRPGAWLDGFDAAFQVTNHGGGSYTVDQTILGLPCGQTDGGALFTLDLAAIGEDGPATIVVQAVHARDCGNQPVAVGAGPDGMLVVCNTPIAVAPAALPDGSVGTPYHRTLAAGSGTAPFTWSVSAGTLPDGITLGAGTGEVSGTPTLVQSTSFAVEVVDANGCSGSRSHTMTIFAAPPVSSVAADASGLCVSTAHPCVSVPVVYQRAEAAPVRAVSVTFQLDAALSLCTPSSPASSIQPGPWLAAFTTSFQIIDHGGGAYTVDQVILGDPCGATDGGELFTLDVQAAGGDGLGTITILAAKARDCANQPVAVAEGPPAGVPIQRTLPAPITDLAATAVASGNGTNPTMGVAIGWSTGSGGVIALYRAPFGAYPLYDRDGPVAPPDPGLAPGGPWEFVADSAASGYVDNPPRGFWYYVAFTTDSCGNVSPVSNVTDGALDYVLGDVSNGAVAGLGDNRVRTEDVSLLGAHYGISGGAIETAGVAYLDVGPTIDGLPASRPTPDHAVGFEDLMIFATNFGTGATVPRAGRTGQGVAGGDDEFSISSALARAPGDSIEARIRLRGSGLLRGFSLELAWDSTVVAPVSTRSGGWIEDMGGVVLVPRAGTVDAALLGPLDAGMTSEGEVATVLFRALRAGDPRIRVDAVRGRDVRNRAVEVLVDAPAPSPPSATRLDAVAPNPGRGGTTVWFSLARDGAVDLSIFGVDGRRVRRLIGESRAAGIHAAPWDGRDDAGGRAAPGVYYVRLEAPGANFTRKLVLVR